MRPKQILKDSVYNAIKAKIINNDFSTTEYIGEKELCEMLGVSRTPVREALNRLERENFIELVAQKGARVLPLNVETVVNLFILRKAIEPPLITIACKEGHYDKQYLAEMQKRVQEAIDKQDVAAMHKCDYELHTYFYEQSHNRHLIYIMNYLTDQFQRVRTRKEGAIERSLDGSKQHLEIIQTILDDNYDALPQLLLEHVRTNEAHFFNALLNN